MPTSNNRLLASLSSDDFDLLEPHLESVTLGLRKHLERPNRRIDAVYFPGSGAIAGAGKRPVLYCRDFKLGARHSTLQAQVDLGRPDVPVRIAPCGCDASIRYRRS